MYELYECGVYPYCSRLALGSTQSCIQWIVVAVRLSEEGGHKADHLLPSDAVIKDVEIALLTHIST
jgi:hypothetical protein